MNLHYANLVYFFFNDTATTEIYTLSLHDALPICQRRDGEPVPVQDPASELHPPAGPSVYDEGYQGGGFGGDHGDRKSTRLNSSHANISYAVFCLKKKQKNTLLTSIHGILVSVDFG